MTDETLLPDACRRVLDGARAIGLDVVIEVLTESTRTAEEAASAVGCDVAQIVKSLVFTGRDTGAPYLLLVSGANRVDQDRAAHTIGEALDRPSGSKVREITGFAIGGIPPFGHATPLKTFVDQKLLEFASVWAAAGTPQSLFSVDPRALMEKTGAVAFEP